MAQMAKGRTFISYAHEDAHFCQLLYAALVAAGVDTWYDRTGQAGLLFPTIEQEIELRPVFLIVLTTSAIASNAVRHEVEHAQWCDIDDYTRLTLPIIFGFTGKDDPRLMESSRRAFRNLYKNVGIIAPENALVDDTAANNIIAEVLRSLQVSLRPAQLPSTDDLSDASPDELIFRGKVSRVQGNVRRTHVLFQRATQEAPESFDAWIGYALSQYQMGWFSDARDSFDHALGLTEGRSIVAWNGKANALYAQQEYEKALTTYEQAITRQPTYAIAWSGKGNALRKLKLYDEAKVAHQEARRLSPNNLAIICNYGILLCEAQQYDEARYLYDQALASHPDNVELWCGKADALFGLKKYPQAQTAYRKGLALEPTNSKLWLYLGDACYENHQYADALDAYEHAADASATDATALNGKGNALRHLGQWQAAANAYTSALALQPDDEITAALWLHLALAYDALGEHAKAMQARVAVAALDGGSPPTTTGAKSGAIVLAGAPSGDTTPTERRYG
ncbi:MAG TPA: tetratricopeptide repeat protein [Ktedonobacterales bacterium]|nr:tetratricopeptide repeat protein [Ktedonobacterales bacterium]